MKVWTCTMFIDGEDYVVLGVFSDNFKAEEQARIWVEGVSPHAEVIDRKVNRITGEETIYYSAKVTDTIYDSFTATIESFTLDEMSY